jgi:hypothetical protein
VRHSSEIMDGTLGIRAPNCALFNRAANCFLLFAGLIPIAIVAWYVITQGSQGPVGDQWWDSVYIAVKMQTGTLKLEDLLVLSVGHRPAIIRLITAYFTVFTHYDAGVLRYATFITTLFNLGLTMLLLRGHQGLIPISFFLSATLLFSLYGWHSWLDMYFSTWQQALFFMLVGLLVLQWMRPGWLAFSLIILCAIAASFTMASGLLAWISLPIAAAGMSEYRRPHYAMLWLLVLVLFLIFYTSDYAVHPFKIERDLPSLNALRHNIVSAMVHPFRFQAVRFDTYRLMAPSLALISSLVLVVNWWQVMRSKDGVATAALWGSLALFALGVGALVLLGRGPGALSRYYGPGSDGFWLAFIALALLVLARRPAVPVAVLNIGLLLALVVFSVQTDIRALQALRHGVKAYPSCDQSIIDYPLYRGDLQCYGDSEEQSVYHLAALRLSVFRDEMPRLILPRTDAPVITDMPNRWLSVYVRDYMMAGLPWENLYSIAPVAGVWPLHSRSFASPYNRGEWSTDILPRPLRQIWKSATELASDLPTLTHNQPVLWYLNTPETEENFFIIERTLTELDYTVSKFPIRDSRYASARFGLWCVERKGSGGCPLSY